METPSVPPRMKVRPILVCFGRFGLFQVISAEIQILAGMNFSFLFPFGTYLFRLLARSKLKVTVSPLALSLSLKVSGKEIGSSIFQREFCTSRGTL